MSTQDYQARLIANDYNPRWVTGDLSDDEPSFFDRVKSSFNDSCGYVKGKVKAGYEYFEEEIEGCKECFSRNWDHYVKDRYTLHGLPLSIISTMATSYLLSKPPYVGALFGGISYIVATCSAEFAGNYPNHNQLKTIGIVGVSYLTTKLFMENILRIDLSHKIALGLAIGSIAGHILRDRLLED